jgi:hypothetical protein
MPERKAAGRTPFLSKKECAAILSVSIKVINKLIETGQLPLTDIPDDTPASSDLFGQPVEPPREVCVLRSDLVKFLEQSLLCHKPVLSPGNDR